MNYKKILIAVDNRETSFQVAKVGFELAENLNAESALIYVIDKTRAVGNTDAGILPGDALTILKKEAQNTLDQLVGIHHGPEKTSKFMPVGLPKEDILKTAKMWGADLIVAGLHGKSGISLWVMGSIAQHILLHSEVPVLVVPVQNKNE